MFLRKVAVYLRVPYCVRLLIKRNNPNESWNIQNNNCRDPFRLACVVDELSNI